MMPNFAAVKTEPASGNISAPIGFSSVKSEPPISNYGGKMCTKFEQHGSSSPMLANGIGGSSGVDEKPYICAGCNYKIVDRYLLNAADKVWHENCLRVRKLMYINAYLRMCITEIFTFLVLRMPLSVDGRE